MPRLRQLTPLAEDSLDSSLEGMTPPVVVVAPAGPPSETVVALRRDFRIAAISQFVYQLQPHVHQLEFNIDDFEADLEGTRPLNCVPQVLGKMLNTLANDRNVNATNWQNALRRQYNRRFPEGGKNPFQRVEEHKVPILEAPVTALPPSAASGEGHDVKAEANSSSNAMQGVLEREGNPTDASAENASTSAPTTLAVASTDGDDASRTPVTAPGESAFSVAATVASSTAADVKPETVNAESGKVEYRIEQVVVDIDWLDVDLETKITAMYSVLEWHFVDPEKFRRQLKWDIDDLWRLEPIGRDREGNKYFWMLDRRLWIQRSLAPLPSSNPSHKKGAAASRKGKEKATSTTTSRRQSSSNSIASHGSKPRLSSSSSAPSHPHPQSRLSSASSTSHGGAGAGAAPPTKRKRAPVERYTSTPLPPPVEARRSKRARGSRGEVWEEIPRELLEEWGEEHHEGAADDEGGGELEGDLEGGPEDDALVKEEVKEVKGESFDPLLPPPPPPTREEKTESVATSKSGGTRSRRESSELTSLDGEEARGDSPVDTTTSSKSGAGSSKPKSRASSIKPKVPKGEEDLDPDFEFLPEEEDEEMADEDDEDYNVFPQEEGEDDETEKPKTEEESLEDPRQKWEIDYFAEQERQTNAPGFIEWETVCANQEDWETFPVRFEGSTSKHEKSLYGLLIEIQQLVIEEIRAVERERLAELAHMNRKRSSRIAFKESAADEAARLASEHERASRASRHKVVLGVQGDDGGESDASGGGGLIKESREERLRKREEERLRREEEREREALEEAKAIAREEAIAANGGVVPPGFETPEELAAMALAEKQAEKKAIAEEKKRLAEEKKRAKDAHVREVRRKRKEFLAEQARQQHQQQQQQGAGGDEPWWLACEICGREGWNLDDGSEVIGCDQCDEWQHLSCHKRADSVSGRPPVDYASANFLCRKCRSDPARRPSTRAPPPLSAVAAAAPARALAPKKKAQVASSSSHAGPSSSRVNGHSPHSQQGHPPQQQQPPGAPAAQQQLPGKDQPPLDYESLLAMIRANPVLVNQLPPEYQKHFGELLQIPIPYPA